jgi:hypothetical protein
LKKIEHGKHSLREKYFIKKACGERAEVLGDESTDLRGPQK